MARVGDREEVALWGSADHGEDAGLYIESEKCWKASSREKEHRLFCFILFVLFLDDYGYKKME